MVPAQSLDDQIQGIHIPLEYHWLAQICPYAGAVGVNPTSSNHSQLWEEPLLSQ